MKSCLYWILLQCVVCVCCVCVYIAADEAMDLEEEDLIEIAEEADLIQSERIIEDNTGPRGGRDGKKNGDMEEAVRAVEEMMLAMNLDNAEIQPVQSEEGWEVKLRDFSCGDCNEFNISQV